MRALLVLSLLLWAPEGNASTGKDALLSGFYLGKGSLPFFLLPVAIEDGDQVLLHLEARGNSAYGKGRTLIYTGAALLPLGLLALVPVMHDGAFGITAADPGIGGFILGAGFGLIQLGIPVMGIGADRLDAAASGRVPGYKPEDPGWRRYRQGWRWIGYGGILLAAAVPFAAIGGLDYQNESPWVDYTALALGSGGLCLGAAGIVRHGQSLFQFTGRRNRARNALESGPGVSLQPLLRWDVRGLAAAGMRLSAGF